MSSKDIVETVLAESEREIGRFEWEGTFADYLSMVVDNPSISRLSHSLVYEAILCEGVETLPDGEQTYGLFEGEIFGLEKNLARLVQYYAAASQRLEVRRRILLLLGPPAGGKSSIVDLLKRALERYTRTDEGAVYAIAGCPMQEEPLHLIPPALREEMLEKHGVYVEGDLCPRCRYMLRSDHKGKIADVPVRRVVYSEKEAVGIGYYIATNPNPMDSSLLVGSIDESKLGGDRQEEAGKAFRLDGELNIANRGLMEFVEMFKADRHMLTTLLGLAQEQLIKLQKFGAVYADEALIGHSNEGDFDTFAAEPHAEALKDRIIAVQIPYNLRVAEEVKVYRKMMGSSTMQKVHMAPLTLKVASIFAVLSRLDAPERQGLSLIDKLRLYNGEMVGRFTKQDLNEIQRHHPNEGMKGISPRYVMNRVDAVASREDRTCMLPLATLDSLWQGLGENISLEESDVSTYVSLVTEAVKEYTALAIKEIQRAYEEAFDETASLLLEGYLEGVAAYVSGNPGDRSVERDMREIERPIGVVERNKAEFRRETHEIVTAWKERGWKFLYTSEPRIRAAVESRLFKSRRDLDKGLTQPRFARQRAEWTQRRSSILNRQTEQYGYCSVCAEDLLNYVSAALKNKSMLKTPRSEGVEWLWDLNPSTPEPA